MKILEIIKATKAEVFHRPDTLYFPLKKYWLLLNKWDFSEVMCNNRLESENYILKYKKDKFVLYKKC